VVLRVGTRTREDDEPVRALHVADDDLGRVDPAHGPDPGRSPLRLGVLAPAVARRVDRVAQRVTPGDPELGRELLVEAPAVLDACRARRRGSEDTDHG
jgi:hypothetical protein